jgi:hypothetical protein
MLRLVRFPPVRCHEVDADQAVTAMQIQHALSLAGAGRSPSWCATSLPRRRWSRNRSSPHTAWRRIRDNNKALSYLRQSVVNRSRSELRHRVVVDRNAPKPAPDMPSAEQGALTLIERSEVVTALRALPPRQREALVLRYYLDLSEADRRRHGDQRRGEESHGQGHRSHAGRLGDGDMRRAGGAGSGLERYA